ncbi:hypothetical protein GCM10023170_065180 [Phytohabitans houttuyneae]|uniref:Uncharacterized protein n=1 Tax=Phytohabitans houttuyneae TaxID=1076126 RepID=A0A6V8KIB5_9ACTN|nr:hypothetical protein Phou_060290 [Phytohabitans houttuyneae]
MLGGAPGSTSDIPAIDRHIWAVSAIVARTGTTGGGDPSHAVSGQAGEENPRAALPAVAAVPSGRLVTPSGSSRSTPHGDVPVRRGVQPELARVGQQSGPELNPTGSYLPTHWNAAVFVVAAATTVRS